MSHRVLTDEQVSQLRSALGDEDAQKVLDFIGGDVSVPYRIMSGAIDALEEELVLVRESRDGWRKCACIWERNAWMTAVLCVLVGIACFMAGSAVSR